MIEVEVTEGVLLGHDTETVGQNLRRLRDVGLRIALDDFGTGYASLVHLRTYPIDLIKISRSFVRLVMGSPLDRASLEATIGLGQRLGIDIVAVGVETEAQLDYLCAMGCRLAQGFHFSKPLPAAQAAAWRTPLAASTVIPVRRKAVTQTGR
jgi:EAL domain-containing protein (putative c-di-GMP-specific phosphodiesterase class I)